jgi:hypothetical protein
MRQHALLFLRGYVHLFERHISERALTSVGVLLSRPKNHRPHACNMRKTPNKPIHLIPDL